MFGLRVFTQHSSKSGDLSVTCILQTNFVKDLLKELLCIYKKASPSTRNKNFLVATIEAVL